jgi:uncharacterized membrane protein
MSNPQDELETLRAQMAHLTERIYRLEQRAGIETGKTEAVQRTTVVPPELTPAFPTPPPPPLTVSRTETDRTVTPATPPRNIAAPPVFAHTTSAQASSVQAKRSSDLEGTIGKLWLNRIGIIAILVGVSYFLKYAFDNGWIGPGGRVAIGLLAGIGVVLWSERFRSKGSVAFSYSLKAIGIGILYLSLWAASQRYALIPSSVAFVAMILVTASTITLALTQDAEILAVYAMIGGYSTPALVSTGENHEVVLFSYVCLLNLAILFMVSLKPWRRIVWGSVLGTAVMYMGWAAQFYNKTERPITIFFAAAFFAIFSATSLVTPVTRSRLNSGPSLTLIILPFVNAAAFFLALWGMYSSETATLTWYALALAAIYILLGTQFKPRAGSEANAVKAINLLHIAIAIVFITIAIPLKLDAHWITIGWLIESAVLLWVAVKIQVNLLRYFAGCALALGVARLLFYDNFNVQTLVFNARFGTFLLAIAIMGGIVAAGERYASEREKPLVKVAGIAFNVLALIALTLEAHSYFWRLISQITGPQPYPYYSRTSELEIARDFTYSALWILYGAGMMVVGFMRRTAFVRWQALVLIAFTIGKVFLYDSRQLEQIYRILSFIALGVMLMGISYAYHRDWLKLSNRNNGGAEQERQA